MGPEMVVAVCTLAVWTLRKLAPKIPKVLLPWTSVIVAVLTNTALPPGSVSWDNVGRGVLEGLAASGLWSGGIKHLMNNKESK